MSNPMNPDDQLANYIDGLAPAISLEDITRISRSEITILPTSLEGEQITMNDQHDYPTTSESLPEIALIDRASAKRRNRISVWAGSAVAAAAAVAVIGYTLSGVNGAKTTTSTDTPAASEFTESDGSVPEDNTSEDNTSEDISSSGGISIAVIRANDGSFINYLNNYGASGNATNTSAQRSTDGENWQPVELTGLPNGQLMNIADSNGLLLGTIYDYDMNVPADNPDPTTIVSTDGINWITIATPDFGKAEGYSTSLEALNGARLPNGKLLVSGWVSTQVDLEALGVDYENVCGENQSGNEQGETIVEVEYCDGTASETLTVPGPGIDHPETALWTVDADGSNPAFVKLPNDKLVPVPGSISATDDGASVLLSTDELTGAAVQRGTTTDGENWEIEDISPVDVSEIGTPTASYNGVAYRVVSSSNGSANIQRSSDGGTNWEDTTSLGDEVNVQEIAAGPAGLVALTMEMGAYSSPTFDYVAEDGTRLTGEFPEFETTWVLTTPGGETFEYALDGSLFDPTGSGSSDPNVTVEMPDLGEPVFTVHSPVDGSTLLTVSATELYDTMDNQIEGTSGFEEAMTSMTVTAEREGYALTMDEFSDDSTTYTLVGPDGSELMSGTLDDAGNPSGEGVELTEDGFMSSIRFFDPATGQDYVTFGPEDMMDAFNTATQDAMISVSEPFAVTQDGYTLDGTIPAGEWRVTDPEGNVIATFQSTIFEGYTDMMGSGSSSDDEVRSIDPLTRNVTILDNGNPVVTFAYADIVDAGGEAAGEAMAEMSSPGGSIYFSSDQGASWQELSALNGWASSAAVGDDEVLVSIGDGSTTNPVRIPVTTN